MVIRVKIKIKAKNTNRSIEVKALVNSGAESENPLIAVTPQD
nr:hypothetical protein [Candidatus Baldrarchaeota archaeon]